MGEVAYRLELPAKARIHDVFHVSLLKKFEGTPPTSVVPLPDLLNGRVIPSPEKVIRARLNRGVWELLVQWVRRAPSDATWENLLEFKSAYPSVQLEDALFVGEGEMLSTVLWAASTTEGRSKERRLRNKVASGSHGAATEERESSGEFLSFRDLFVSLILGVVII